MLPLLNVYKLFACLMYLIKSVTFSYYKYFNGSVHFRVLLEKRFPLQNPFHFDFRKWKYSWRIQ